ncbi:putative subtilase-type serine protease precursor [Gimesia alba]|uniref:Putative subtilase-type serine protease n=1 Tax=Gimesia alba TaxID=2527973 RepID=A0A517RCV9_9PLAN|nr:PPC domain-containing protein [Gimesia alba]QDT41718.1 putative subtilase-type serine protease precursor [Gimesia alba]
MYRLGRFSLFALSYLVIVVTSAWAELPNPVLKSVFPPGAQSGSLIEVTVSGTGLDDVARLICSQPDINTEKIAKNRFRVKIPQSVPEGVYDLRVLCRNGLSSPRTFFVGNRSELLESEPNETVPAAQTTLLDVSVNGRIEKKGDVDCFQFSAAQGQRVVIECWADRIDSSLRAILEVYDSRGRRLAVNRGFSGIDPLINFKVPVDGTYFVKVFDLVYSGSSDHFYRLDIDTGPRMLFSVPAVIQRGATSQVSIYGWNLGSLKNHSKQEIASNNSLNADRRRLELGDVKTETESQDTQNLSSTDYELEKIDVTITAPTENEVRPFPIRQRSEQADVDGFAFHLDHCHAPLFIGLTDVPVLQENKSHQTPETAQEVFCPSEVSGQLIAGNERDWYAIQAKRGEVLWLDAFGQRINSPVDLDISVLDASAKKTLKQFRDEVKNIAGKKYPVNHLDPAGKWVVPEEGRYVIMVRNLRGGLTEDQRRVYRLSIRRQVPEFHLAAISHQETPAALNLQRGGRAVLDVIALRKRGMNDSIRVSAGNLPQGIHCPDIWLGPGEDRGLLTITADEHAVPYWGDLTLNGFSDQAGTRKVHGGTIVRTDIPNGSSRLTTKIPLAVTDDAPFQISAERQQVRKHILFGELELRHAPGSVLDIAVHLDRRDLSENEPVHLVGASLPGMIQNQTATIPAGKNKGYLSFYLPPYLPVGQYTITVQTQALVGKKPIVVFSNPVTFDVKPATFVVAVDTSAPQKIRRGETIQVKYSAKRINGFINKIHTELEAADKLEGLRVRGVTFVGQTEQGTLQIIANDDAPLGKQPSIRLFAVGVVEDQPIYHGSCFLDLEITE